MTRAIDAILTSIVPMRIRWRRRRANWSAARSSKGATSQSLRTLKSWPRRTIHWIALEKGTANGVVFNSLTPQTTEAVVNDQAVQLATLVVLSKVLRER